MTPTRKATILRERLGALDAKAAEIARMTAYLRAKIAWIENGERGAEPLLGADGDAAPCPSDAVMTRRPPRTTRRHAPTLAGSRG